jgi:hypothetical protein
LNAADVTVNDTVPDGAEFTVLTLFPIAQAATLPGTRYSLDMPCQLAESWTLTTPATVNPAALAAPTAAVPVLTAKFLAALVSYIVRCTRNRTIGGHA